MALVLLIADVPPQVADRLDAMSALGDPALAVTVAGRYQVPLAVARDSRVLAAAYDLLPRHLAHLGGELPGAQHGLYWLNVAADRAHREGL